MATVLRRVILTLGIVYVVYLFVANLAMSPRVLAYAFAGADTVDLAAEGAYSVFPFFVHVRTLRINAQDQNVQARITVENASGWIDVRTLIHRKFKAIHVRGEHATFRMRMRVDPWDMTEGKDAGLPPVPPNLDPPVTPAWVEEPAIDWAHTTNWEIEVEDADIGVREGWIEQIRYETQGREARARGKFDLKGGYEVSVDASLDTVPGTLKIADQVVLSSLEGPLSLVIEPFLIDPPTGRQVLRWFDLDVHWNAVVESLEPLTFYLPPQIQVADGSGKLELELHTKRGVFLEGSEIAVTTDRVVVTSNNISVESPAVFTARAHDTGDGKVELTAQLQNSRVDDHDVDVGHVREVDAWARLKSADIVDDVALTRWHAATEDLAIPELPRLNRRVKEHGLSFVSGALVASGNIDDVIDGDIRVESHERVKDLGLDFKGALVRADASSGLSLVVRQGAYSGAFHWGGDVSLETPGLRVAADCDLDVSGRDLRPIARSGAVQVAFKSHDARLGKTNGLALQLRDLDTTLDLDLPQLGLSSAVLRAKVSGASAKVADVASSARIDVKTSLSGTRNNMSGSATISVRDGRLAANGRGVDAWWGDIVSSLRIDVEQPSLAARARLRLRDAAPFFAVLAADGDVPAWLAGTLSSSEVNAEATAEINKQTIAVALLSATEGELKMNGRMIDRDKALRGAFLVRLQPVGVLSAGILLDGQKAHISPLVGADWLQSHGGETSCLRPLGC